MINTTYYTLKPFIPRKLQIFFRRHLAGYKREKYRDIWPIDPKSGNRPANWNGWPGGKKFALVLSHDIDTQRGHDLAYELLKIEKELGFRSAFNFVAEKYPVSKTLLRKIKEEGFGIGVHGIMHDGKLFKSRKIFNERAKRINHYLEEWQSKGFTAPSMICQMDWIHDLKINHSTCTFDTDPFEPVPNPSGTIFPYKVNNPLTGNTIIELPYTLPQDHALFIILQETDITIWKKKLEWIFKCGGMALLNTHPDYMGFSPDDAGPEIYPIELYKKFLTHILTEYDGKYWHVLPSKIASFWRKNRTE